MDTHPHDLLDFWTDAGPAKWFKGGEAFDRECDRRFRDAHFAAADAGDGRQLAGQGVVEDVTWRNTTIRRASGEVVIVPNSVLGKSLVINFSRNNQAYKLVVPTTVAYGTDPAKVELIALNIANRLLQTSPDAYKGDEPTVRFVHTDPTGITFNTVLPILSYNDQWKIKSQFIEALQKAFEAEGIEGPRVAAPAQHQNK